MACYLNSYKPLASTIAGRDAMRKFGILPMVDGSIRRESDLEHEHPAITCLCRRDKFAPRLKEGDLVAYSTKKHRLGRGVASRHLTAVLRVIEIASSHDEGAAWYRERQLRLPNNCMVQGNPAKPFQQRHQGCGTGCGTWDRRYQTRAKIYGTFVICERLWHDLSWDAPVVEDEHLWSAFDKIPGTRNPGSLPSDKFDGFLDLLGVLVSSSR